MSYEPTLIIRKADLERRRSEIENSEYNTRLRNETKIQAWEALRKIVNLDPVCFPEIAITICQPELTAHNAAVRKLLDELGIGYQTSI